MVAWCKCATSHYIIFFFLTICITRCLTAAVAGPRFLGLGRKGPHLPSGCLRTGHWNNTWCAVCTGLPQVKTADRCRPQQCMLALKQPTPLCRQLRVTHTLRGRSAPSGNLVSAIMLNWDGLSKCCQSPFHCPKMLKLEIVRDVACRLKGQWKWRHWRRRFCFSLIQLCGGLGVLGGLLHKHNVMSVVFSAEGWESNSWYKRQVSRWCSAETTSDDPPGVIDGDVHLLSMDASTTDRGSIFWSAVDQG